MHIAERKSVPTACWACPSLLSGARLVCESCGKIQPPSVAATYFEVFGLPNKLHIDAASLERSFHRLSRKLHPDLYVGANSGEQQWSLTSTSLLNDAYRTLKMPISRTEYLLKLEGVEIEGDSAAGHAAKQARTPPDLLEEVFELNMQLEEMRSNRKMGEIDPQLSDDLLRAKAEFESQLHAADENLEALWTRWDAALDGENESQKTDIKEKLTALLDRRRYVLNLVRDVNEAVAN